MTESEQRLHDEQDDRSPLDDERDAFLARVREEEGWEAYCRVIDTEWELSRHQWNGGHLS